MGNQYQQTLSVIIIYLCAVSPHIYVHVHIYVCYIMWIAFSESCKSCNLHFDLCTGLDGKILTQNGRIYEFEWRRRRSNWQAICALIELHFIFTVSFYLSSPESLW